MKRYTREEVDPNGIYGEEMDKLFGKRKTISVVNILDSDIDDRQFFIWKVDIDLWERAVTDPWDWDTFEANIREALK